MTTQTIITISLPDDGDLPRTGTILVKSEDLGTVNTFHYSDLEGIMQAVAEAAGRLMQVQENPPPKDVVAPKAEGNVALAAGKKGKAKDSAPAQAELPTPTEEESPTDADQPAAEEDETEAAELEA